MRPVAHARSFAGPRGPLASSLALGLVIAVLGSAACKEPVAEHPPAADPSPAEKPAAPTPACTDWSSLDPATLPALPASEWSGLLDHAWRVVLRKHFDPTLRCLDWPALRLEYAQKLTLARDKAAAYRVIDDMLRRLGHSHVRLFGAEQDETPPTGPAAPDLKVRWLDDALVVVRSSATGHLGGVPSGARLVAIEDHDVDDFVKRIRERTTRPAELAFEVARAAEARLSCPREGRTRKVTVTDPARDDARMVRVLDCVRTPGERVTLGHLRDLPTRVEHRMLDERVGYLAFNVWMLPMVERVRTGMNDLRAHGMDALVLDLRGNPGGVGAMAVPVARLLVREGGSLGTLRLRGIVQQLTVPAESEAFTGPMTILVDEGTASTSEIFTLGLRELGRTTVVGGGPSAGAALPSLIEALDGGAILQYVVGEYVSPRGEVVEHEGVVPDVLVPEHRADFAAGRDPVLDAAVLHLRERLGHNTETP
jgi:carboxyl-terminal processing protease